MIVMKREELALLCRLLLVVLLMSGCSAAKYLKEGESFYAGSAVRFDAQGKVGPKKKLEQELEQLIVPKPNTEVFGMRPGVWLYFRQRDDQKNKGIKAFIRKKFGQVPVLMSDVKPDKIARMLEGQLQNNGYFGSEVSHTIKERKKESKVIYNVILYPPYKIRNINYPSPRDSMYARIIRAIQVNSLLKPKQNFDVARLQAEQQRIESEVENFGVFYFDDRYLIYEADSTVGYKQIDLDLKLEQGIPDRARRIFRIGEINVYPEYTLDADTATLKQNGVVQDSINYYSGENNFKPHIITDIVNIRKGQIYKRDNHALTLSHLMDLGVFKFVNIQYAEMPGDDPLLKANIFLTPLKKHSLRLEFQTVSKSNSFVGPGIEATYTNRNLFRGAELFQVRGNSSYEVQISKRISGPLNSFELGFESNLTVPRFITPFKIDYSSRKYLPKTDFRVGLNLQNRVGFFRLNSFSLSSGYLWRETEAKSHELYPIDIVYVQTGKESEEFVDILRRNRFLQSSFEDQFIVGTRYSYTLNNQLKPDLVDQFKERRFRRHSVFFNTTLQAAGNLLNALQKMGHGSEREPFRLLNAPYSQFVRGDIDFRHYWQFDEHNKLASRLVLGAGYAHGNSEVMPYIRQFSIAGSNSIRAFPARSVGPGSYNVVTDTVTTEDGRANVPLFIDQRADIKIEGNVELRFDIIKAFKGAVFVDAGNIWLWEEDPSRPGGVFNKEDFYSEMAVGTGLGFRFDLNFFVLRLDIAFPLRKPHLPKGDRWVFDRIDFGSPSWRGENLIYNIAIGYPF
jgi:outer membrane protein insertion porin family